MSAEIQRAAMPDQHPELPTARVVAPAPRPEPTAVATRIDSIEQDRQFLSVLLDNLSEGIVACDGQGNLVLFNRASQQLHGLPPEPGPADEWAGHYSLFDRDGKTLLPKEKIPLFRAFNGEAVSGQEMVVAPKGRPARILLANAQRITTSDGRMLGAVAAMHDITEQKAYEAQLFEAKELAQITLSAIADGVIRTNRQGLIEYCNPAALALLHVSQADLLGKDFDQVLLLIDADSRQQIQQPLRQVLESGLPRRLNLFGEIRTPSGMLRKVADSIAPIRDITGEIIGAVFVFQDMTDAHAMAHQLSHQARTDFLTGIPNRLAFEEKLAQLLRLDSGEHENLYLFYMDFDHFKLVNDTCGHRVGDQLLQQITTRLRAALQPEDFIARIGGDEFAILLKLDDHPQLCTVAEKLITLVSNHRLTFEGRSCAVGLSIGIVNVAGASPIDTDLLAKADTACYVAKELGRGRFHLYSQGDLAIQSHNDSNRLAQRIQPALENDGFELYLEHIVSEHGTVMGYEALLRMIDADGSIISPALFIPVAQRMGWGSRLDQWVIQHALGFLAGTGEVVIPAEHYLSVNVSARSLGDASFVAWLLSYLESHANWLSGLQHHRLHLEITETEYLANSAGEKAAIKALRDQGIAVWLDDFGAGYNSFELLKRIPVDGVKIDRSFTNSLENDPVDAAMIRTIAALAQQMNFQVIAEGVEDLASADILYAMGIRCFQGWLFHRACKAVDAIAAGRHEPLLSIRSAA